MLGPAFFDIPVSMLRNIGLQERDTPAVLDAIELQNKHQIGIVHLSTTGQPRLNIKRSDTSINVRPRNIPPSAVNRLSTLLLIEAVSSIVAPCYFESR